MDPSGIRIGVPAVTTRGMKEKEIKKISLWINNTLDNYNKPKELKKIHKEVKTMCKKFPI